MSMPLSTLLLARSASPVCSQKHAATSHFSRGLALDVLLLPWGMHAWGT
jgi:hypothetical protein